MPCMKLRGALPSPGRRAAGTLISRRRDMAGALMTSIVLKRGVTLLDIVSTRMLGQYGFMARRARAAMPYYR